MNCSTRPLNDRPDETIDKMSRPAPWPAPPPEEVDPPISVATVCVAEPELDAWWKSLDIEAKADAFVMFSLAQFKDTHLDVSAPIPYSVVDPALVPREA